MIPIIHLRVPDTVWSNAAHQMQPSVKVRADGCTVWEDVCPTEFLIYQKTQPSAEMEFVSLTSCWLKFMQTSVDTPTCSAKQEVHLLSVVVWLHLLEHFRVRTAELMVQCWQSVCSWRASHCIALSSCTFTLKIPASCEKSGSLMSDAAVEPGASWTAEPCCGCAGCVLAAMFHILLVRGLNQILQTFGLF